MTWRLAWDLDSTVTADPDLFRFLSQAARAAGAEVFIITGTPEATVSPETVKQKKQMLAGLAIEYDVLQVCPPPVADNKRKYCQSARIDLLIDNKPANISAVFGVCSGAIFVAKDEDSDSSPGPI